jgi:L-threonylcarbamoyladenylate synthase
MAAEILSPSPANIRTVADCVRSGGVGVVPSDTNMALTVAPDHPEAIERVYDIKDRPRHKPLTLFVREPSDWRRFGSHDNPELVDRLAEQFWPGPLNLVLERDAPELDEQCAMDGTVSVGCLANPVWREFADAVGGPVAMTSANVSGTVPDDTLVTPEMARDHLGDGVDYLLGGQPDGTTRASTILSLAAGADGEATVLRQGDVTDAAIERAVPWLSTAV